MLHTKNIQKVLQLDILDLSKST